MKYYLKSRIAKSYDRCREPHTHHIYDDPYNAIKDACDIAQAGPHLLVWVINEFDETLFDNEPMMPYLNPVPQEA